MHKPVHWDLEGIGYLLGVHVYYKPETPCWWTWETLHRLTDAIWERGENHDRASQCGRA